MIGADKRARLSGLIFGSFESEEICDENSAERAGAHRENPASEA